MSKYILNKMIQIHAQVYDIDRVISITTYISVTQCAHNYHIQHENLVIFLHLKIYQGSVET